MELSSKNPAGKIMSKTEIQDKEFYFLFLDQVRESGKINMFGAAAVLREVFNLSKAESREILFEWMDTFRKRDPA